MEVDAELLLDELGQAWSGPQFGREPVLRRVLAQPAADDLLLRTGQLGRAARYGPRPEPVGALLGELGEPTPDRPGRDVEELGNLVGGVSFEMPSDGELAAMFQFRGCAFGSHAPEL